MSPAQLEANRRNALKSTGPRTPKGQVISNMNASRHGIFCKEAVVRGRCIKEDDQEFTALHRRLRRELEPAWFPATAASGREGAAAAGRRGVGKGLNEKAHFGGTNPSSKMNKTQ